MKKFSQLSREQMKHMNGGGEKKCNPNAGCSISRPPELGGVYLELAAGLDALALRVIGAVGVGCVTQDNLGL